MEGAKKSVKELERHLSKQLETRERLLKDSRDVISACSRAIISVHQRDTKGASKELARAGSLLRALKSGSSSMARYIVSPETEFVEASAVLALARGEEIPTRSELGASPEAYLLGLLDTVGELKRLVLDSIMNGRISDAKGYFGTMEELYAMCSPMAVYDHVVNGTRRKIDVARMLVEDTRGLLTEEVRRESVNSSLARVEGILKKAGRR